MRPIAKAESTPENGPKQCMEPMYSVCIDKIARFKAPAQPIGSILHVMRAIAKPMRLNIA